MSVLRQHGESKTAARRHLDGLSRRGRPRPSSPLLLIWGHILGNNNDDIKMIIKHHNVETFCKHFVKTLN